MISGLPFTLYRGNIHSVLLKVPTWELLFGNFQSKSYIEISGVNVHVKMKDSCPSEQLLQSLLYHNSDDLLTSNQKLELINKIKEEKIYDFSKYSGSIEESIEIREVEKNIDYESTPTGLNEFITKVGIHLLDLNFTIEFQSGNKITFKIPKITIADQTSEKYKEVFNIEVNEFIIKLNDEILGKVQKAKFDIERLFKWGLFTININILDLTSSFNVNMLKALFEIKDDLNKIFINTSKEEPVNEENKNLEDLPKLEFNLNLDNAKLSYNYDQKNPKNKFEIKFQAKEFLKITTGPESDFNFKIDSFSIVDIFNENQTDLFYIDSPLLFDYKSDAKTNLVDIGIPSLNFNYETGMFRKFMQILGEIYQISDNSPPSSPDIEIQKFSHTKSNELTIDATFQYNIKINSIKFHVKCGDDKILIELNDFKPSSTFSMENELSIEGKIPIFNVYLNGRTIINLSNTDIGFSIKKKSKINEKKPETLEKLYESSNICISLKNTLLEIDLTQHNIFTFQKMLILLMNDFNYVDENKKVPIRINESVVIEDNSKLQVEQSKEFTGINIEFKKLKLNFKDLTIDKKSFNNYQIILESVSLYTFLYSNEMNVKLLVENFQLSQMFQFYERNIISSSKNIIKKSHDCKNTLELSFDSKVLSQIPTYDIKIKLYGILFEKYYGEESWINLFSSLIIMPSEENTVLSKTIIDVTIHDFVFNYNYFNKKLLIYIGKFDFQTESISINAIQNLYKIHLYDISFLVCNRKIEILKLFTERSDLDFPHRIVSSSHFKLILSINNLRIIVKKNLIKVNNEANLLIDISKCNIRGKLHYNTFEIFSTLLSSLFSSNISDEPEIKKVNIPSPMEPFKVNYIDPLFQNLNGINFDEFLKKKKGKEIKFNLKNVSMNDYFNPNSELDKSEMIEIKQDKILQDQYIEITKKEQKETKEVPNLLVNLKDVSIDLCIHEGLEWSDHISENHIKILFTDINESFSLFENRFISETKIKDITFNDNFKYSKYKTILEFDVCKKKEYNFELFVEAFKRDYQLEISLSPLIVTIHEKIILFINKFMERSILYDLEFLFKNQILATQSDTLVLNYIQNEKKFENFILPNDKEKIQNELNKIQDDFKTLDKNSDKLLIEKYKGIKNNILKLLEYSINCYELFTKLDEISNTIEKFSKIISDKEEKILKEYNELLWDKYNKSNGIFLKSETKQEEEFKINSILLKGKSFKKISKLHQECLELIEKNYFDEKQVIVIKKIKIEIEKWIEDHKSTNNEEIELQIKDFSEKIEQYKKIMEKMEIFEKKKYQVDELMKKMTLKKSDIEMIVEEMKNIKNTKDLNSLSFILKYLEIRNLIDSLPMDKFSTIIKEKNTWDYYTALTLNKIEKEEDKLINQINDIILDYRIKELYEYLTKEERFKYKNNMHKNEKISVLQRIEQENQTNESNIYFSKVVLNELSAHVNLNLKINFEDIPIRTKKKVIYGIDNFTSLKNQIINHLWDSFVNSGTIINIISSQSTIKSFLQIGAGFFDLFVIPISQTKEGTPLRGIRIGFESFLKNITLGTTGLALNTFEGTNRVLVSINKNIFGQDRSIQRNMPNNATSGMLNAYSSFSNGLENGYNAILTISHNYRQNGVQGVANSGVQIVFSPLIGTTSALSQFLYGARAYIDPKTKKYQNKTFK